MLTFNLLREWLEQLEPHLANKDKSVQFHDPACCASPDEAHVVAAVMSVLQAEVFFLQQLQVTAHFVEEVAAQNVLLAWKHTASVIELPSFMLAHLCGRALEMFALDRQRRRC